MKRYYYILLSILVGSMLTGCSSSKVECTSSIKSVETGGDWSGHSYMHYCPEYTFSETGTLRTPLDILGNNHISLAGPDCAEAITKAREHIAKHYGNSFLDKCSLDDIDIVYKDSIKAFERRGTKPDLEKCGEAKYFVRFLLNLRPDTSYRLGIAMDENFTMISEVEFANFDARKKDLSIIGAVEAHNIATRKHCKLVKNAEIELDYDQERNRFVWVITGESKDIKPTNERSTRRDFEYGFVCINASTSAILIARKRKGYALINPRYF